MKRLLTDVAARRPVGLAFLAAAAGVQLVYTFQSQWFLNQFVLTVDDTYYFLQIARNIAHLGWSTFDGVHTTNGVQFLWTAILTVLALIIDDRMTLIRAMLVVCVTLNFSTGLMLRRFGMLIHSRGLGETLAVFWALLLLWSGTSLTGMEYSLQTASVAALLLCWWRIMTEARIPPGLTTLVGIVGMLNFWVRLDSAVFSVIVLATASVRLWLVNASTRWLDLLRLWMPATAGAVGYGLVSWTMGETLVPISGIVKGVYAAEHFEGYPWWVALAGHLTWWCRVVLQPPVDLVAAVGGRHVAVTFLSPFQLALVGLATAGVSVWGLRQIWADGDERTTQAAALIWVMGIIGALHAAIVVRQIGHFAHTTKHYYGWLAISWSLWAALLLQVSAPRLGRKGLPVIVGLVLIGQTLGVAHIFRAPIDVLALRNVRTELVGWIDSNLPPHEAIGSWNAGQFGYFLNRPVVNLDGLVNDSDFLESLRRKEQISQYLRRQGVRYVVDYNDSDLSMPYLAEWDRNLFFRNEFAWTDVDRLQERRMIDRTLHVVRLKK